MSFLGGAECSTAGNPLSQFTKHVQDDKSLQRDRLVGRTPGGLPEGMRSRGMAGGQDKMMDEFLQQSGQLPQGPASPFAMEQMRRELENYQATSVNPGSMEWASEYNPEISEQARMGAAFRTPESGSFSPAEFARFQNMRQNPTERTATPPSHMSTIMNGMNGFQSPMGMGYGVNMGMGGMGGMGMMNRPYGMGVQRPAEDLSQAKSKGKGRMVELDDQNWEEHFAQIDAEGQRDLDAEANAAIEAELNATDRSVFSEANEFGDFESIWRGIQAEKTANGASRSMADDTHFSGLGEGMHMGDFDSWEGFENLNTHGGLADPQLSEYMFEEENFFKDLGDPFGEGMRILEEGGNLSLAALAFEAAVQKDPEHVEAWSMLGSAQAQNEKETPAIRALEEALKIDPSNLAALMGLAVSYTNEGYDSTAYRTLERWLATKYPTLIPSSSLPTSTDPLHQDMGFTDRHALHEKVTELYISAAQLSPDGDHMDPDVQVGLGVLFYGAEEYEKAVDCFSAALASSEAGASTEKSQLHLLWNRLGATLANSGRSEEAIAAYEKALVLRPNFVRARYNLGVSCINIGCYDEAAQHLLGALAMHKVVEREGRQRAREVVGPDISDAGLDRMIHQNSSTNLYDTLRRVFSLMGRRDLADSVGAGMDVDAFRAEFDF
ncbi:MAG: hypothetical protein M1819_004915 [Sarea resinae]|nr:MAG: hypothetical protein M1819_004915 [Sarea resinae]